MEQEKNIQQLKDLLQSYVEGITKRSKGAHMYVCPLCHSGEKAHGTGAFSIKDRRWKCFSCGEGGDIFDLIGKYEGIHGFGNQLKRAKEFFGLTDNI